VNFDPKDPCRGAQSCRHSHLFTADGAFDSKDENGEQVDDGKYEIVRTNRVMINNTRSGIGSKVTRSRSTR
jgi:hypothetical protein